MDIDIYSFCTAAEIPAISDCNLEPLLDNVHCGDNDDEEENNMMKIPPPIVGFTHFENLDVSFIIKERMTQALRHFKESTEQHQILAQIWAPVRSGNRYVLTTSGQPFMLGPHSNGLNQYRTVSLMYMFAVDGETDGILGLPGRVFTQKLPEWTPNVQYYSSKEYPQVNHAKHYNVRGTLALPVFEASGQSCVGVLELITTSQKINYAPEVDKVCKALEAVNLRSSETLDHSNVQICNEGRQNALAEILEVLTEVCETYKLPLAQTWIPCMHQSVPAYGSGSKGSCSRFNGSCSMERVCMSTTDVAFYVVDAHMWGFRAACAEHHLQKGQGVAGTTFASRDLSFCGDISQFRTTEYPLVHYARMFGLSGSFAICLRSKHTGDDDYVLEFYLPSGVTDSGEQLKLLDSILATMKKDLQNLMVASGNTFEEERKNINIIEVLMDDDMGIKPNLSTEDLPVVEITNESHLFLETSNFALQNKQTGFMFDQDTVQYSNEVVVGTDENCDYASENGKSVIVMREVQRKKFMLEDIQPLWTRNMSQQDAGKVLGVSRSTMKRRLRQLGIQQWPSSRIGRHQHSDKKMENGTDAYPI